MKNESVNSDVFPSMNDRKITLADGRYMIFYAFDESLSGASAKTEKPAAPKPRLEAAEEKDV